MMIQPTSDKAAKYAWFGQQCLKLGSYGTRVIQDGVCVVICRYTPEKAILIALNSVLVTSPRPKNSSLKFPSDSSVSPTVACDDGYTPETVEVIYGNYSVYDADEEVGYSISAPPHDLAYDTLNYNIPGYNLMYGINKSQAEQYTAFNQDIYSGGDTYSLGTLRPSIGGLSTGLILGLALVDGVVHIAQLVIENKKSYTEFLKGGITSESSSDLGYKTDENPSGWELVNRIEGGNRQQWFYVDGKWIQYTKTVENVYEYKGTTSSGGLDDITFTVTPTSETLNGKPLVLSHTAQSIGGFSGTRSSYKIDIYTDEWAKIAEEVALAGCYNSSYGWRMDGCTKYKVWYKTTDIPSTVKSGTPSPVGCMTATSIFTQCSEGPTYTILNGADLGCADGTYSNGLGYLEIVSAVGGESYALSETDCSGTYVGGNFYPQWNCGYWQTLGKYQGSLTQFSQRCNNNSARTQCVCWYYRVTILAVDDRYLSDSYFSGLVDNNGKTINVPFSSGGYLNKVCKVETYRSGQ